MDSQNKQLNKANGTSQLPVQFNLSNTSIFRDNPQLVYVYKKTEKLVSAIYMLSSFISDNEPIKWQMRQTGLELLSHSLSLSNSNKNFTSTVLKLLSFLEVSFLGGVISEMNYKIFKFEFESLIQTLELSDKENITKSLLLSEHFFDVANQNLSKGQESVSDRVSFKKEPVIVKDKPNRQEIILSLLKKNKELGIKDFVSSISDCSEKTIQRELAHLVAKGTIRKEGEKRWSRYSLK